MPMASKLCALKSCKRPVKGNLAMWHHLMGHMRRGEIDEVEPRVWRPFGLLSSGGKMKIALTDLVGAALRR